MNARWLMVLLLPALALAEGHPYIGRAVVEVIDDFRVQGVPFAYSTNLVTRDLEVLAEPDADDPVAIVMQILEPHGLQIRAESGVYLVVPATKVRRDEPSPGSERPTLQPIEEIAVSASRYEIAGDTSSSRFLFDQREIESNPDFGDDPLRVVQRLPGAAASGASARTHFRGGEESEIGIMLNGQRLFDPFHVRDFQSIFSVIDSRAIDGVEVFTGGFPVHYGDRMSGMIVMDSLEQPTEPHNELGISVYNTSALTAGSDNDRHWLVSARRGNLDLVIDPRFGSPSYSDLFARFGFDMTPGMSVALNTLYADDNVEVVLESDPEDLQRVTSDTRNRQVWLEIDNRWSDRLSSRTVLSALVFDNLRQGMVNDEESIVGFVHDRRETARYGFRQDFSFRDSDIHLLEWGLEVGRAEASYDYRNAADYFGLAAMTINQPASQATTITAAPDGGSYSLYFADRWKLAEATTLEWGLRWDDQTYTGSASDAQLSPRLSVLHGVGDQTELRVSLGRYYQAQGVHELQVEDGIDSFWPAQSTDQLIASFSRQYGESYSLRLEAFYKHMRNVRPRFENLYDPLGVIPELQPDRVRLEPQSATAQGFEVSVTRIGPGIDWWATYTWSQVTDRIGERDELRSWDQAHAFQFGAGWSNERWDISLAAGVHTGWPSTELFLVEVAADDDGESGYVAVPGPRNDSRYPWFGSVDLRIARTWQLPNSSLMAFIEVSNATNRRNECCLDWDLDEDDDTGEVFLERGVDYWLPLLPAIGIRWEF